MLSAVTLKVLITAHAALDTMEMEHHAPVNHIIIIIIIIAKKQESYATTISWVRAKVSFALLRSALLCLRRSRTPRRRNLDVKDRDLEIEKGRAGLPQTQQL